MKWAKIIEMGEEHILYLFDSIVNCIYFVVWFDCARFDIYFKIK